MSITKMASDTQITGARDGVNKLYTNLEPYQPGSLHLWHNGQGQDEWFIEIDPSLGTFETLDAPLPGDHLGTLYSSLDSDPNIIIIEGEVTLVLEEEIRTLVVQEETTLSLELSNNPEMLISLDSDTDLSLSIEESTVLNLYYQEGCDMAVSGSLEFTRGQVFNRGYLLNDGEDLPIDLTGYEIRGSFRDSNCEGAVLLLEVHTGAGGGLTLEDQITDTGKFRLKLQVSDTLLFTKGRYYFDLWVLQPPGDPIPILRVSPVNVLDRTTVMEVPVP